MKASLVAWASGLAVAAAGGPAAPSGSWEVDGPPQDAAQPLARREAPNTDLPPADWDDDGPAAPQGVPQGYAAPIYSQPPQAQIAPAFNQAQEWASTDVGRHWASQDTIARQVTYGMARLGNMSHTYHIDPHLLADVPDATSVCGSVDQIHDCGFSWLAPVCTDKTSSDCVRGLCICTASGGCTKPECEPSNFECRTHKPLPLPSCVGAKGCLTKPGRGWSCWHPCNMQHEIEDYGAQKKRVKAIRATGVCGYIMSTNSGGQAAADADPALLADEEHASGFCGSQDMVKTCGFTHLADVCTGPDCYKGVCVCTQSGGCLQPQCKSYPGQCPTGLAKCKGDGQCLAVPGNGWSCWHPCNLEHSVEEFGHQAGIAQAIRNSGNCTKIGVHIPWGTPAGPSGAGGLQPQANINGGTPDVAGAGAAGTNQAGGAAANVNDTTPDLDGGIMLHSAAWPIIPSGESEANAGGASRRRADRHHQPDHDSKQEIVEVTNSWNHIMQGKLGNRMSENGKRMMYGMVALAIIALGCVVLRARKTDDEKEDAH